MDTKADKERATREAATWDDVDGSECQYCDAQIPPEREFCPDCGYRSTLLGPPDTPSFPEDGYDDRLARAHRLMDRDES